MRILSGTRRGSRDRPAHGPRLDNSRFGAARTTHPRMTYVAMATAPCAEVRETMGWTGRSHSTRVTKRR